MGLSIADIDMWDPESISAVGAAAKARAEVASQASSGLRGLSAFDSWEGEGASAAEARTQAHATGLDLHCQAASAVATAANTAASEVRQVKSQLNELRSTLGQYGITVDANGSRAVPPTSLSSLPAATRKLVQDTTNTGQQSLNQLRRAADQADALLAAAIGTNGEAKPKRDNFDLDTQFNRPQGLVGMAPPPGGVAEVTAVTAVTVATVQLTVQTHSKYYGCGAKTYGQHCAM